MTAPTLAEQARTWAEQLGTARFIPWVPHSSEIASVLTSLADSNDALRGTLSEWAEHSCNDERGISMVLMQETSKLTKEES